MAIPRRLSAGRLCPAPCSGRESHQERDRKCSVLRLAREDGGHRAVEWFPAQFDINLLSRGTESKCFRLQVACNKDADRFVAAAWSGEEIQQYVPGLGGKARFFQQFPSGSRYGIFVGNVENVGQLIRQSVGLLFVDTNIRSRAS